MARYSSDSDSSSVKSRSRRRRSRSSSSSDRRKGRSSSHRSKHSSSRSSRSHKQSKHRSRHSRAHSSEKSRRRRSYSRERSKKQSRDKNRRRSRSRDKYSKSSRRRSTSSSSSSSSSSGERTKKPETSGDALRNKLLQTLKNAETKKLPFQITESVIKYDLNEIHAIEDDSFVPKTFISSKNVPDIQMPSEKPKPVKTEIVPEFIDLVPDDSQLKLERWIKKLYAMRQKALNSL